MILIKIGGGKKINLDYICEDIKTLIDQGEKIVLVHGASVVRDEIAEKIGSPTKIITSPTGRIPAQTVYLFSTSVSVSSIPLLIKQLPISFHIAFSFLTVTVLFTLFLPTLISCNSIAFCF